MVERTKGREELGRAVGDFRRRYFHRDLDLRLDGPQTIGEEAEHGRAADRRRGPRKGMGRTGVRSKVSTGG